MARWYILFDISAVDSAYLAGFFDGEGSIGIYTNGRGKSPCLRTQLTQNVNKVSTEMMAYLVERFGGNYTKQTTSHGVKYNWQLNGDKAKNFLIAVMPNLRFKREQAELAVLFQDAKALLADSERKQAADLMKLLKKQNIDQVMENQKDLVEIVATLKQVLCVKG